MNPDETTIAIMGQHVPARHERIPIDKLHFPPRQPPRVRRYPGNG